MKIIRFVFILLFSISITTSISYAGEDSERSANWMQDFEAAKTRAAEEGLPLLISFSGSDWCLPCMKLDRDLFSTNEFIQFSAEHLVLLKLDFPARKKNFLPDEQLKHNEALADVYNTMGSFPLVILTDESGDVMGKMTHPLPSTQAYINSILAVIQK